MTFTHHELEFTKTGEVFNASQESAILAALAAYTDVIVVSHGWNNDKAEAAQLYDALFASIEAILPGKPPSSGKAFGVIRIFWPSKRFAPDELIPGGGASLNPASNNQSLLTLLDQLKRDPGGSRRNRS